MKTVKIYCPKVVQKYNKRIRITDRQDENMDNYRIAFCGKKRYWSIFTWVVEVTAYNA